MDKIKVRVSIDFTATPNKIVGGGYWAEIKALPGCVAMGNTLDELTDNLVQAALDWCSEETGKTEEHKRALEDLQRRALQDLQGG